MKLKILILLLFFLSLISCVNIDDEDYNNKDGFIFIIANKTGKEYNKAKLTIGGLKNGKFIATDSLTFPKLLIDDNWPDTTRTRGQIPVINGNRWKPNLNKIREMPADSAYFKFQLDNTSKEILLYDSSEKNKLVSINLSDGTDIPRKFEAPFSIAIKKGGEVFGNISPTRED